jgi:TfoX/Sxy family transcriptional regulator of competence genes
MPAKPPPKKTSILTWEKSSDSLVTVFENALKSLSGTTTRKVFGYPAAFANGYMFAGVFKEQIFVRLGDDDSAALIAQGGLPFEPMPGRQSNKSLVLPARMLRSDADVAAWVSQAYRFATSSPPKPPKASAKVKTAKASRAPKSPKTRKTPKKK